MNAFIIGDPSLDFFEQNPELRYLTPFAKLLEENSKDQASKIAWAVYMTEDPNARLYRRPKSEKQEEIARNYLKDEKFEWKEFDYLISAYPRLCLSKDDALFKVWGDTLDEIQVYIKELKIEDKLDGIKNLGAAMTAYKKAEAEWFSEKEKGKIKGRKTESLSERMLGS